MSELQDRLDSGYYAMDDVYYPGKDFIDWQGVVDKEARRTALKEYRAEEARRKIDLRNDLIAEYNLEDHPKANEAFDLAWEEKHSSGVGEVADFFYDLSRLMKV